MTLAAWPVWPFEPNWSTTPVQGVEYLTVVAASPTGAEQRRALRFNPRRDLEYTFNIRNSERAWAENFLMNTWNARYWLPLWPEMTRLVPAKVNNQATIPVPKASLREYKVGGPIALVELGNRRKAEVVEIASVQEDSVTLVSAPKNTYEGTVMVAPALVAYLSPDGSENIQFTRVSDSVLTADVRLYYSEPGAVDNVYTIKNGPLIMDGLIVNSYKNALGRGGYFHEASGTSEGQFIFIHAALMASTVLSGGNLLETVASAWYRRLVYRMLDAMGDGSATGPILRQPIPQTADTLCELHWLFAARGDVSSRNIVYAFEADVSDDGKIRIPESARGATTYNVWKIFPATSELLYQSIQSPSYDIANPQKPTQTTIAMADDGPHPYWEVEQFDTAITIPAKNDNGDSNAGITRWKIVYGYNNSDLIPRGAAYEAFPDWSMVKPGYVACAPDTFRWFDAAMDDVKPFDVRQGNADKWSRLQAAMKRTCVRGQAIDDLRTILRPLPGFDAIPVNGDPDGMYCYSSDPFADPPTVAGANFGWTGYDLWARDDSGNIIADLPKGYNTLTQYQIGRGFDDTWRTKQTYQDPDWYLYLEIAVNRSLQNGEMVLMYVSATQQYDRNQRWLADLSKIPGFSTNGVMTGIYIPLESFRLRASDDIGAPVNGNPMQAGQTFQAYGLSFEVSEAISVVVGKMRPVSGPSRAWVDANQAQALLGSKMPFFPGSLPFAINADTKLQQFVGWNGSPFQGYQQPDLWVALQEDAEIVHSGLVLERDVAIPANDGSLTFPISATDVEGNPKPKAAILCEQQTLFLSHAQQQYKADGGPFGPFAHTFVLNTPARKSLSSPPPTPHTWVYTNDDPNTRWVGYQARPVESLALLALKTADKPGWATVRDLALNLCSNFLSWLNTAWPSSGNTILTDFPDPRYSGPQANYDEPHAAALFLRACLWLKQAAKILNQKRYRLVETESNRLLEDGNTRHTENFIDLPYLDSLMTRLWEYMERIWAYNQGTSMAGTWSDDPASEDWYGFWHGEVIITLCQILKNEDSIPEGIDLTLCRKRLMDTYKWLRETGVRDSQWVGSGDYTSWNGYPVFPFKHGESTDNTRQINRLMAQLDTTFGPVVFAGTGDRPFNIQQLMFTLKGPQDYKDFDQFFRTMRGQQIPFWLSSRMTDFTLAENVATGDLKLKVADVGYADYVFPMGKLLDIVVHYRTGDSDAFHVTGAYKAEQGFEVITVQEPFLRDVAVSEVLRISYLRLSRFAQDRMEYSHVTGTDGVTQVTTSFQEAPEIRKEPAAYYST